jgi:membrane associated rhomboid family serine protease
MFPLHDSIAPRTFPWVTYGIIALCSLAFLLQVAAGPDDNRIVEEWGMIPARVMADEVTKAELTIERPTLAHTPYGDQVVVQRAPMPSAAISDWVTLLTCMFLHGGLMHFAGNMWFLHIFGDNVEDRLGHAVYAALYVAAGLLAGLTHLISNPGSSIPTIGASGAIAGVMGAYILLYPKSVIETVIPLPLLFTTFPVPAPIFLGIWFLIQVFQGAYTPGTGGGVAWWAHVGGFVAGLAAAGVMLALHWASPPAQEGRVGYLGLRPHHDFPPRY